MLESNLNNIKRIRYGYAFLLFIVALFLVRLFYLQIIRHDYYKKAALSAQLKQYEVQPVRGAIKAHDGDSVVPLVLNEIRYTLFADPKFIDKPEAAAHDLAVIIGGNEADMVKKMRADSRYAVLAKKLTKQQKNKIDKLGYKGIGTREEPRRTYPDGSLAAQLLGFVNDDGEGKYGVEQYLNSDLAGKPGQLKAITDAQGVPLVASKDNVINQPVDGKPVVLTIDVAMQRQLEDILKAGLARANSNSGSALIIDPYSGAIKAMANYPTYNPAEFYKVRDGDVYNNAAVSAPLEVGSVMKPLTLSAALDQGVVKPNTTFYDPGFYEIDRQKITDVEEVRGAGTRSIRDIIKFSLNTGATWLLMQMGGGQINERGRNAWHDYMANHYQFGRATGIEQGFEASGYVPSPKEVSGINIQYANTTFGEGMSATPLQLASALSSIINGGRYYQPRLVEQVISNDGKPQYTTPKIINDRVISAKTSSQIRSIMTYSFSVSRALYGMTQDYPAYVLGGKSGTPQVPKPGGGYYSDRFNGMFMGFVGGDKPQYVAVVRVNEPHVYGYAGAKAAAPIFVSLADMLINNFGVTPKTK